MDKTKITDIMGYILVAPALISVPYFLYDLVTDDQQITTNLSWIWTGAGDNHTSSLPVYFGLMALAGVYLLKDKNK